MQCLTPLRSAIKFPLNVVRRPQFHAKQWMKYSTHHTGTLEEVKLEMSKRVGLEAGYHPIPKSREHLLKYQPVLEDLPPRAIKDSLTSAVLPLGTNKTIQDRYVSHLGRIRYGRLMEEMDLFAVWICHRHIDVPTLPAGVHLPYTFVTLLVDKVEFTNARARISSIGDIRLSGHVCWTGRSSMEIVVWVEQKEDDVYRQMTKAIFLMVARNATNTGAAPVNPLIPADANEAKLVAEANERQKLRRAKHAESIFKVQPTHFEQTLMYELYQRTTPQYTMELDKRVLPTNCRWMSESFQTSVIHSFPENRNAQNTVFGGFIMRCAVEISWISACTYCKNRPMLKCISDISFEKPVSVDSFIKMTAYVVYTYMNYMQIMTVADVLDARTGNQVTSNVFYFTYVAPDEVAEVLPRSYHETMWYIHGRRKFLHAMNLANPDTGIENENK